MGIFDWLFGSNQEKTGSTKVEIPKWIEDAGKSNYQFAQSIANKPYEAYGGPGVADFSGLSNKAFDLMGGMSLPALLAGGGGFDMSRLGEFMNPFTQSVIDSSISDMIKGSQIAGENMDNAFHQGGAFGDMRQGAFDAENLSNLRQDIGRMSSGLNMQNFNQAMDSLFKLPQFENQQQQNAFSFLDALLGGGGLQENKAQQGINWDYGQWQEKQGDDINKLNILSSALSATPYSKEQTTYEAAPSTGAKVLGTGLNIASMFI